MEAVQGRNTVFGCGELGDVSLSLMWWKRSDTMQDARFISPIRSPMEWCNAAD
jgi:hypothetical protein